MKIEKFISCLLVGSVLFLGYSCSPDDEPSEYEDNHDSNVQQTTPEDPHAKDEYYVRYSAGASSAFQSSVYTDFFYTGEKGNSIKYHGKGLNVTIGPVKYGFNASVSVSSGGSCRTQIEVSKNNGPFAQKVYHTSSSASYTIDF